MDIRSRIINSGLFLTSTEWSDSMSISRRSFLAGAALCTAAGATRPGGLRIGVTDWNLQQTGKLEAVNMAKSLGFDGVQVSLARETVGNKLPLDHVEAHAQALQQARHGSIA